MFFGLLLFVHLSVVSEGGAVHWIHRTDDRHHYLILDNQVTWPDAAALCQNNGGYLVSINDATESQFLLNNVFINTVFGYWIGLHRHCSHDYMCEEWKWNNGDNVTFSLWENYTIVSSTRHQYVVVESTLEETKWFSADVQDRNVILCEIADNCSISSDCPSYKQCVVDAMGVEKCECFNGSSGDMCETYNEVCQLNLCFHGSCISENTVYNCSCDAGWTGVLCTEDVNECLLNPCPHGFCQNTVGGYLCNNCNFSFYGENCNNNIMTTEKDDSSKFFTDIEDTTVNFVTYLATTRGACQFDQCIHGTCVAVDGKDECICGTGWTGSTCADDVDECTWNPCRSNGNCINLEGSFICVCKDRFAGKLCQIDVSQCDIGRLCANGGIRYLTENSYVCQCKAGWRGQHCEQRIKDCVDSSNCVHGKYCRSLHHLACTCDTTYTGYKCNQDINECLFNPCKNGGTCFNQHGTFTCVCPRGLTGKQCECDIDECLVGNCEHGECVNSVGSFECHCNKGYSGANCQVKVSKDTGLIVGLVVGVIVLVVVGVFVGLMRMVMARKRTRYSNTDRASDLPTPRSLLSSTSCTDPGIHGSRLYQNDSDFSEHLSMSELHTRIYENDRRYQHSSTSGISV